MINEGGKKEEYRTLGQYWWSRIFEGDWPGAHAIPDKLPPLKHRVARIKNGYRGDSPAALYEIEFVSIGEPSDPTWAPEGTGKVIRIHLGEMISRSPEITNGIELLFFPAKNYYGKFTIFRNHKGETFFAVENYNGYNWREISEETYQSFRQAYYLGREKWDWEAEQEARYTLGMT